MLQLLERHPEQKFLGAFLESQGWLDCKEEEPQANVKVRDDVKLR